MLDTKKSLWFESKRILCFLPRNFLLFHARLKETESTKKSVQFPKPEKNKETNVSLFFSGFGNCTEFFCRFIFFSIFLKATKGLN